MPFHSIFTQVVCYCVFLLFSSLSVLIAYSLLADAGANGAGQSQSLSISNKGVPGSSKAIQGNNEVSVVGKLASEKPTTSTCTGMSKLFCFSLLSFSCYHHFIVVTNNNTTYFRIQYAEFV